MALIEVALSLSLLSKVILQTANTLVKFGTSAAFYLSLLPYLLLFIHWKFQHQWIHWNYFWLDTSAGFQHNYLFIYAAVHSLLVNGFPYECTILIWFIYLKSYLYLYWSLIYLDMLRFVWKWLLFIYSCLCHCVSNTLDTVCYHVHN